MATITGTPFFIKDAVLTLGSDDYTFMVKKAELIPTTNKGRHKNIGGGSVPVIGSADWVLSLDFAQDYVTAASLSNYAFDNHGKPVAFTLKPQTNAAVKGFSGTVAIEATNIGGTGQAEAVSSVNWDCVGPVARVTT